MEIITAEKTDEFSGKHPEMAYDNQGSNPDGQGEGNHDQVAPGRLIEAAVQKMDSTRLAEIPVDKIRHFDVVPDYLTPSSAPYPVLVCNNGAYECIERWDEVEKAKEEGQERIQARIIDPAIQSEMEVALRKATSRVKTEGGEATYPELVKVTKHVLAYLMQENESLVVYSHGGNRKGGFDGNLENDAFTLLADRMGKARDTVRKYAEHGKYISDEILDELARSTETKIGKAFFTGILQIKSDLADQLKAEGLDEDDITLQISMLVLEEFEALKERLSISSESGSNETGNDTSDGNLEGEGEETSDEAQNGETKTEGNGAESLAKKGSPETKKHDHTTPAADDSDSPSLSLDQVKTEVLHVLESNDKLADEIRQESSLDAIENKVRAYMERWRELLTKLRGVSTADQQSN